MHYRNGREAKNGDKVIQLGERYEPGLPNPKLTITAIGVLFDATPGNDHCNGSIAPLLGGRSRAHACATVCTSTTSPRSSPRRVWTSGRWENE